MTLSKLADGLGVSLQQVQKYEAGTDRLSAGRLFDIALFLEVPIGVFFPLLGGLSAGGHESHDPENEVLSFLSNAQNWQLYCSFRRIKNVEGRNALLEMAKSLAS